MGIKIPLGIESFGEMREGNYYYVDKTSFIKELLSQQFKVNLVTRPRRFGKSLMMSMLEDFFDISRDSCDHFAGLEISKEKELCDEYMNQWPVVMLSLKDVDGLSFEFAYGKFKMLIAELARSKRFLIDSAQTDFDDKKELELLCSRKADTVTVSNSLLLITRMLAALVEPAFDDRLSDTGKGRGGGRCLCTGSNRGISGQRNDRSAENPE